MAQSAIPARHVAARLLLGERSDNLESAMFSSRSDEWTVARWRQPNVAGLPLEFNDDDPERLDEVGPTPLWKDLMVASALALVLWLIAAVVFLG